MLLWGKLFLGFGSQDLESHFSTQVPTNTRQAQWLAVIGVVRIIRLGETTHESSAPLGAATSTSSHDFMILTLSLPLL